MYEANKVILNGIGDTIKGILQSVADNVTNFVSCIGDQVVGGYKRNYWRNQFLRTIHWWIG